MSSDIPRIVSWEGYLFAGILAAIVAYKALAGTINFHGLLHSRPPHRAPEFSAGRAQMLVVIVSAGLYYALQIMHSAGSDHFPPVPRNLLWVVGASQAAYLGGKTWDMLLKDVLARGQKGGSENV